MKESIYRCDNCGRIIKTNRVVIFEGRYVLLLCDYTGAKACRPTLSLEKVTVCLDCLVPFFRKWVEKIDADLEYII